LSGEHVFAAGPDGTAVFCTRDNPVLQLWKPGRWSPPVGTARERRPGQPSWDGLVSPDGRIVFVGDGKQDGRLRDGRTGEPIGRPIRGPWRYPAFSRDGRMVATTMDLMSNGQEFSVGVWDTSTGRPVTPPLTVPQHAHGLAFSPDGATLAVGYVGLAALWDLPAGRLRHLVGVPGPVNGFAFSADGKFVAMACRSGWEDKGGRSGLSFRNVATGEAIVEFIETRDTPALFPDPDGVTVWSYVAKNGRLRAWDLRTGRALGDEHRLHADQKSTAFAFRADAGAIAVALPGGEAVQWDTHTGRRVGPALPVPVERSAGWMAYSPAGDLLAVGYSGGVVRLYDAGTARQVGPPLVHRSPLAAIGFAADGSRVVTAQDDGNVQSWPVPVAAPDDPVLLTTWLEIAAGWRGGSVAAALTPAEWAEKKAAVAGLDIPPPERGAVDRQLVALRDAEGAGSVHARLWCLDRLVALRPDDGGSYARRAGLWAMAGRLDRATADVTAASRHDGGLAAANELRHAARAAAQAGDRKAAQWLLDRVIGGDACDWEDHVDRARVREQLGLWDDAEADLTAAGRLGADDETLAAVAARRGEAGRWASAAHVLAGRPGVRIAYDRAVALLRAGDRGAYRKVCDELARSPAATGPRDVRAEAAWVFALDSHATDDWSVPLKWIETALEELARESNPDWGRLHSWRNTHGVLLYRAGRYREAADVLETAIRDQSRGGFPQDWLFLGLALRKLGAADDAKRWLDQAPVRLGDADTWTQAEWGLFRSEADGGTMQPPGGSKSKE
jgi:WD40 repeat protein/tetratricopeptide (TPR) repeat protein